MPSALAPSLSTNRIPATGLKPDREQTQSRSLQVFQIQRLARQPKDFMDVPDAAASRFTEKLAKSYRTRILLETSLQ